MVERDRANRGANDVFPARAGAGSRTVDAVLDEGGMERVELLKMHIEGADPRGSALADDVGALFRAPGEGPL